MKLHGKKILITGANKGIGREIGLAFAREGAEMCITYHSDLNSAQAIANEIGKISKCRVLRLDLNTLRSNKDQQLDEIPSDIDVLVNNAGILSRKNFLDITEDDLEKIMHVNFFGIYYLTQKIVYSMINKKIRGSIINIGSISDTVMQQGLTHYQCAKAALTSFTKGVALELSQFHIRVNSINPGLTKTEMNKTQWLGDSSIWQERVNAIPLKRAANPKDYTELAILLASDQMSYATGSIFTVDGGRSCY
jgi:glucose 1-dehydrogenase